MMPLALVFLFSPIDPSVLTIPITPYVEPHASTSQEIAEYVAKKYGLHKERFLSVIGCESGWNEHARGDYENGRPTSFGLAQFHHPVSKWGMTVEEADTPEIALEVMAKKWSEGEAWRWSCWLSLYGGQS